MSASSFRVPKWCYWKTVHKIRELARENIHSAWEEVLGLVFCTDLSTPNVCKPHEGCAKDWFFWWNTSRWRWYELDCPFWPHAGTVTVQRPSRQEVSASVRSHARIYVPRAARGGRRPVAVRPYFRPQVAVVRAARRLSTFWTTLHPRRLHNTRLPAAAAGCTEYYYNRLLRVFVCLRSIVDVNSKNDSYEIVENNNKSINSNAPSNKVSKWFAFHR